MFGSQSDAALADRIFVAIAIYKMSRMVRSHITNCRRWETQITRRGDSDFSVQSSNIESGSGMPRLPNRAQSATMVQPERLNAAMKSQSISMPNLREQKPVLPCILPINNPSLEPETFNGHGGFSRRP